MRVFSVLLCSLFLATGCSKPQPKSAQSAAAASPGPAAATSAPYNTEIPMAEIMVHVMNSAAYQFWSGWGTVDDAHGSHDLSPKTEAQWKVVEDGAATVVAATNAIMVPGYVREPQAEWNRYAQDVAKIALRGKQAAERKDKAALGVIGEQLDTACDECHAKFAIPPS